MLHDRTLGRKLKRRNSYIVNAIGKEAFKHLLSCANSLHSENPLQVEADWIKEYKLSEGDFDISDVDRDLVDKIPTCTQMGKVYARLIDSVTKSYDEGILDVYNSDIATRIDNYNSSAYYEPSYVITRVYLENGF